MWQSAQYEIKGRDMSTRIWFRSVRYFVRKGRFPDERRRAKWEARQQFHNVLAKMRPGDIAIDCGANVGKFTEQMAATGATVYAFEPDPFAFGLLQERLGNAPNVTLINKAVGTEDATVTLYRSPDFESDPLESSVSSSVFSTKKNVDARKGIVVDQINILEFLSNLDQPVMLLKIDIEGSEIPILEKLLDGELLDKIDHLFVEMHDKGIPELASRGKELRINLETQNCRNINFDWR